MKTALNTHELAWAAGLFDAEGSVSGLRQGPRRKFYPQIGVSQGGERLPEILLRFQAAIGGFGYFHGPVRGYLYYWRSNRYEVIQAVGALLWRWLGPVKREQLRTSLLSYLRGGQIQTSRRNGTAPCP